MLIHTDFTTARSPMKPPKPADMRPKHEKSSAQPQARTYKRYKSAQPVASILQDLLAKQQLGAQNPAELHYRKLLLAAIPQEWHGDLRIGRLHYQQWEIFVIDSALAYRLNFLAPEIRRIVGEKLPHVPKLMIKVDPAMKNWYSHRQPKSLPPSPRRLTDREADDILNAFFAKHGISPK